MAISGVVQDTRNAVLIVQRQLQGDQTQVDQDSGQLRRDRARLDADERNLTQAQQRAQSDIQIDFGKAVASGLDNVTRSAAVQAQNAAPQAAAAQSTSAQTGSTQPQVNAEGQTIGQLINVVA